MEWVLAIIATIVVINLVYLIAVWRMVIQLGVELKTLKPMILAGKPKQARIKSKQASQGIPVVDAKAVTVRRDTDDLPLTGRMSTGVHRKKMDFGAANDDRLQQG